MNSALRKIEATVAWMEREIFASATSFHQATEVIRRHMEAKQLWSLGASLVVNGSFAIELYLKCLLFIESGKSYESHDLAGIFAELSIESREALSKAYGITFREKPLDRDEWFKASADALAKHTPEEQEMFWDMAKSTPNRATLEERLDACKDSFIDWRYSYEGISPESLSFDLDRFYESIRAHIQSLRPFIGFPKGCTHRPPLSGDAFWQSRKIRVPTAKKSPANQRKKPEWQTRDMFGLASIFHGTESLLCAHSHVRRLWGMLHAAVLNNALSTELYLKCLLFIETGVTHSGHDLEELFRQLPRKSKDQLESDYRKRVLPLRNEAHRRTIAESVRISGRTFEDGRYFYEGRSDKIHYTLFGLNVCLRARILAAKPELEKPANDRI